MNIPEYITIDHWYKLQGVKQLKSPKDLIKVIQLVTELPDKTINSMKKEDVELLAKSIFDLFTTSQPKFWAVFHHKGIEYGFQPPSKMTLGEWIDIEEYGKNYKTKLAEMVALLYRPITKSKWKNPIWRMKYNVGLLNEDTKAFDIYEVEEYDETTLTERANEFKDLPIEIALGAMAFFLTLNLKYVESMATSSLPKEQNQLVETLKTTNTEIIKNLFHNTTAGS